jgi:hypothetical protein
MATKFQRIASIRRKFIWLRQRNSRASRFGKQHGTICVDGYETPTNRPRVPQGSRQRSKASRFGKLHGTIYVYYK